MAARLPRAGLGLEGSHAGESLGGGLFLGPPGRGAERTGLGALGVEQRSACVLGLLERVVEFLAGVLVEVDVEPVLDEVDEPVGCHALQVEAVGDGPAVEVLGYAWVAGPAPEGADPSVGVPKYAPTSQRP